MRFYKATGEHEHRAEMIFFSLCESMWIKGMFNEDFKSGDRLHTAANLIISVCGFLKVVSGAIEEKDFFQSSVEHPG